MKIEGYFRTVKRANETRDELKKAGFSSVYVDMNDHYVFNRNTQINLAGTSTGESLSELVLKSGEPLLDRSVTPLSAANPMVSGISDVVEITDFNSKVVVEVDSNNAENAKEIIKNMGGVLDNPNVKFPKGFDNVDIAEVNIDNLDR